MRREFSDRLLVDVNGLVKEALDNDGAVNVPVIAEAVRKRNLAENVALEDIEQLVLSRAQILGAPMSFATGEIPGHPGARPPESQTLN